MPPNHQAPLVSAIIPAYNQGPLLAAAVRSALAQTYPHIEVIVVNDGSPEGITRSTTEQFGDKIIYIERENGGVAAARNTGIEAAKGELIALLDQDDIWLPEKIEREVRAFQAHPGVGLVHSSYFLIDETGTRTGGVTLPDGEWQPLPSLLFSVPVSSCTTLFPRRVLEEVGFFDASLQGADDWDLWLRIAKRGYSFYCVEARLAEYRVHNENQSRDIDLMVRSSIGVLDKFYSQGRVPSAARDARSKAYAERHAWAAALYYGAGREEQARSHLAEAAGFDARRVTSGRFLQSLVYSRTAQPNEKAAGQAVRFAVRALDSETLLGKDARRLRSNGYLVMALHSRADKRAALRYAGRALAAYPRIVAEPELWQPVLRRLKRAKWL